MSEAGREPSRVEARPFSNVEEIASAYLIEADGDLSLALRQAIEDALADLMNMERRALRAERLISRAFLRGQSVVMRIADQRLATLCPIGDGASALCSTLGPPSIHQR